MNTLMIITYVFIGLCLLWALVMLTWLYLTDLFTNRKEKRARTHAARLQWLENMSNYYDGDADEAIEDMIDKPGYEWLKDYRGCSCPTLWLDHGAQSCVCGYEDRMNA